MKHLTLKQIGKIIFWTVFALVLLCPAHLEGEWHFWPWKLFTQGIEPAGKEPMAEFSKSPLLQDFQRIPYKEANEERKLQIIADVLKEL